MRFGSNPSPRHHKPKRSHLLLNLALTLLFSGLAFRLFLSGSIWFSFSPSAPSPVQMPSPSPVLAQNLASRKEKCDMFTGDWVADRSGPPYTNASCSVIEDHQNCMKNGRPDTGYLYWRWKPRECELGRFDPKRFLEMMRNRSWGFVGDSISRNHVQSMLCILSQVAEFVEVYHDKEHRSKRWHFPAHNFSLSVIWTPFLLKSTIFEDLDGVSSGEIQLHLDRLDQSWTQRFPAFDYTVIAAGKWFLKTAIYHENDAIIGCHYCPKHNLTELGFRHAYRKAIRLALSFVATAPPPSGGRKKTVILRTTTPDHFENGEWFTGGTCNRTAPYAAGGGAWTEVDAAMRGIEVEEFKRWARTEALDLRLLDTTYLSMLRPDGHPGPYRKFQPFASGGGAKVQNDCLHWCLPGPIDSWNDLVMGLLDDG